ncbi:MAG: Crp/Fnr family transcriptional regulator [Methyloceanibacter sp.]|nr:Crp/Fnr family transcriptional regulator [Methyloceanibacter sp.]
MLHSPKQSVIKNHLLARLKPEDAQLIESNLKHVELARRQPIEQPNKPIKYVYFPESGMVSIVTNGARKKQLEVGIIGREGVTGLTVILGNDRSPHSTYVQMPGDGYRITADDLRCAIAKSPTLHGALLNYVQAFMTQTAHTAASNGSAKLEERLARWLLMAHDRTDGDDLPLVHEFLALMLGVRRPGVTVALHTLEAQGLIRAARASIHVIDRAGLEELAGGAYGVPEAEYRRLMA